MSIKIYGPVSGVEADTTAVSKSLNIIVYDNAGVSIGPRYTYDAAPYAVWSPPATPTDVMAITIASVTGSIVGTSRLVRVTRVRLSGVQNVAGTNSWFLVKRSTQNTAGTSISVPIVPRDTNNPQTIVDVRYYTANPTVGTLIANVRAGKCTFNNTTPPIASTTANDTIIWDFDEYQSQPMYIVYPQTIAINFAGAALPAGLSLNASFTWTEE